MLGCPHAALEQIEEGLPAARRTANQREQRAVDLHVARGEGAGADREGYTKIITDAGGVLMTDTCSAFAQALPPGTKVAALDSAKQAHYLPAIMNIQAWFGSTARLHQRGDDGKMESGSLLTKGDEEHEDHERNLERRSFVFVFLAS